MPSRFTVYLFAIVSFVGSNYIGLAYGQTVTCMIPPGGATCDLPGFASVTFPTGAFVTPAAFTPVTVSVTSSPQTQEALNVSVGVFDFRMRLGLILAMFDPGGANVG